MGTAVADYYRALLLNAVLPAGVLGDVHRAVSHGRRSGDLGRGVRAVVIERLVGQAVLFVAVGAALVARPALPAAIAPGTVVVVLAVLTAVAVTLLWRRVRGTWAGTCSGTWSGTWSGTRSAVFSGRALPLVLLLSAAALAGHVGLFIVAARAVGTAAPVLDLVPLVLTALLVMSVPVNVGGWGPREAFLAMAFGSVGLGAERGLSTAVAYGVLAMAASLPGALVLAADYRPRTARQSANAATSSASRSLPFFADAREGRPTTPEVV
ncbi:lysylphosphatidylglycerol synthase transmembrane domain-containing protein [Actinokineospora sp. 24-640]